MRTSLTRVLHLTVFGVLVAGFALVSSAAEATPILSPISATASNSFPDPTFGTVANLINHGGLLTNFTSGVTDFDTYLAGNPLHTSISAGAEWFTDFNQPGAVLNFDMGSVTGLDKLAVWVDEFWGVGTIALGLSVDGVTFNPTGSFNPTDWPSNASNYGADVFSFTATDARYARLTLSNCPQPNSQPGGGCGLGEVAFRQASSVSQPVPEPMTVSLLGVGLVTIAVRRYARR